MVVMNKEFKKALVFFIDILGSRERSDFGEIYDINNCFHDELLNSMKNDKPHTVYERTIHTFSDCAYIIYDFKEKTNETKKDLGKLFEVALCNLEPLLYKFLSKRFLFRGGAAYDDVYYERERGILFGRAINKAYELECKEAKYPRILLDTSVSEILLPHWEKTRDEFEKLKTDSPAIYNEIGNIKENIEGRIIKKDFDGKYMLNYLRFAETNMSISCLVDGLPNNVFLVNCIEMCEESIRKNKFVNDNISSKYEWLYCYIYSVITGNDDIISFQLVNELNPFVVYGDSIE